MMFSLTSSRSAGRTAKPMRMSWVAPLVLTLLGAPAGAQDVIDLPPSLPDVAVYHTPDLAGVDIRDLAPPGCEQGTAGLITNGGFESGLDDWQVDNLGLGNWFHQSGTTMPESGESSIGAHGGSHYAVSDQPGPGTHLLSQSFNVVPDATLVLLRFALFVNNWALTTHVGNLDHAGEDTVQFARVDLLTQEDFDEDPFTTFPPEILMNLYAGSDPGAAVNGYTFYQVDITSLVSEGGDFVLRFAEADELDFFNMGVDDVSIQLEGDFCVIQGGPNEEIELWIDGGSMPSDTEGDEILVAEAHPLETICKLGDDGGSGAELCGAELLLSLSGPGEMTHFEVAPGMLVLVHNPDCEEPDGSEYTCPLPAGTKQLRMNYRRGSGDPPTGPRKLGTLVLDTTELMPGDETALTAFGASAGANLQLRPIASSEQPELIAAFPKPVPEPGVIAMLAFGAAGLCYLDRRRSRRRRTVGTQDARDS